MYSMNVSLVQVTQTIMEMVGILMLKQNQAGEIRIRITSGYTANNLIFKPKLEKGIVVTPYSKYGQGCVKSNKM